MYTLNSIEDQLYVSDRDRLRYKLNLSYFKEPELEHLIFLYNNGKKISFLKLVRSICDCGLIEAKGFLDRFKKLLNEREQTFISDEKWDKIFDI